MSKYGHRPMNWFDAIVNKLGGEEAAERFLSNKVRVIIEEIKEALLVIVGTIMVAARTVKLIVKDELSVGNHDGLQIAYWGDNFRAWFGDLTEESITTTTELVVHKLEKQANDAEILQELGGEEKAETSVSEFHSALKAQGSGQAGPLLTNGYANIFYIRDVNGILRAVHAYWFSDGWDLFANPVESPFRWFDGFQVVSRK